MNTPAITPKPAVRLKQFHDHGNHYCFSTIDPENMPADHLKAGRYKLRVTIDGGSPKLIFEKADPYILPVKRFGDHTENFQRIRDDYQPDGDSMGVMLIGVKGSGKTLMSEELGSWMIGQGRPVIEVSDQIPLALLLRALEMVGSCMMYFDEFGKNYDDSDERNRLITLFSDNTVRGVLFVVTGNDGDEIPNTLINRPGRFKYLISYDSISRKTAKEIVDYYDIVPEYRKLLLWYALSGLVNLDVYLHVVRATRTLGKGADLSKYLQILNVPTGLRPVVMVSTITKTIDGQAKQYDAVTCKWDGETVTVQLAATEEFPDGELLVFPLEDRIEDLDFETDRQYSRFVDGYSVSYTIVSQHSCPDGALRYGSTVVKTVSPPMNDPAVWGAGRTSMSVSRGPIAESSPQARYLPNT